MSLDFISAIRFSIKHCVCPKCSSSISIIALIRAVKANKVKCSVCGTGVDAKRFWSYWLIDKISAGILLCIIIAIGYALAMVFRYWYVWVLTGLFNSTSLYSVSIPIIFIAFLMKGKDVIRKYALQALRFFSTQLSFSIHGYADLAWTSRIRNSFENASVWIGIVFVLVWILINILFLIAYMWITNSISMEGTYNTIIFSGQILSTIEFVFFVFLILVTPAVMFYILCVIVFQKYIVFFPKYMRKGYCYELFLAVYLLCCAVIFPVKISSVVFFYINKSFSAEIDQSTRPLYRSIESFINDYNRHPYNLQELVPDYMDGKSMMIFEKHPYDYGIVSVDEQNFGALYIPVYCGEIVFGQCMMVQLYGRNNLNFNAVEFLPHPNIPWDGRRLSSDMALLYGMPALLNKNQNWSYYTWGPSD